MTDELNTPVDPSDEQSSSALKSAEDQVNEMLSALEDQDSQVWAYLIGGIVALLVGIVAAYYYAQSVNVRRKSRLERIRDTIREGLGL